MTCCVGTRHRVALSRAPLTASSTTKPSWPLAQAGHLSAGDREGRNWTKDDIHCPWVCWLFHDRQALGCARAGGIERGQRWLAAHESRHCRGAPRFPHAYTAGEPALPTLERLADASTKQWNRTHRSTERVVLPREGRARGREGAVGPGVLDGLAQEIPDEPRHITPAEGGGGGGADRTTL